MTLRLYRRPPTPDAAEECFYAALTRPPTPQDLSILTWLIADSANAVARESAYDNAHVVEIGPQLAVETSFSSNATAICHAVGLPVSRLERSVRYPLSASSRESILAHKFDPMTQAVYPDGIAS